MVVAEYMSRELTEVDLNEGPEAYAQLISPYRSTLLRHHARLDSQHDD